MKFVVNMEDNKSRDDEKIRTEPMYYLHDWIAVAPWTNDFWPCDALPKSACRDRPCYVQHVEVWPIWPLYELSRLQKSSTTVYSTIATAIDR